MPSSAIVAIEVVQAYNPDAVIVVGPPFGHTRPQWIVPYGGWMTVDGVGQRMFGRLRKRVVVLADGLGSSAGVGPLPGAGDEPVRAEAADVRRHVVAQALDQALGDAGRARDAVRVAACRHHEAAQPGDGADQEAPVGREARPATEHSLYAGVGDRGREAC